MKRKTKRIIVIAISTILLVLLLIFVNNNIEIENNNIEFAEIIPEEEISEKQLRETTLNLFYINENKEIEKEIVKIDAKELIENPYETTIKLLFQKPNISGLKTYIPINCTINKIEKNGEILVIDLSKDFIEKQEENNEAESFAIRQIVNTMTQFNEINSVKILIDGNEDLTTKTGTIRFTQIFIDED